MGCIFTRVAYKLGGDTAGILDGLYLHLDSLEVRCWQHILALMNQMLHSQQANGAGLSTAGVVGIGRLLMHSADVCADLEQTEQLVGLLVRSYVQPQPSGIEQGLGRWGGGDVGGAAGTGVKPCRTTQIRDQLKS